MQSRRVIEWIMSTMLVMGVGPAWAQSGPDSSDRFSSGAPGHASGSDGSAADAGDPDGLMESGSPGSAGADVRPWNEGVSDEDKRRALALFKEGNGAVRESLFPQAVKKYREALELWDHPGIHFNLALALLSLEQPIAVYRSLEKATQHGEAALDREKLERARHYLDLISEQLGTLEITVSEPGARLTLDGKLVLTGPGTYRDLVLVGQHQVIASKPGHVDVKRDLMITPREHERLDIVMYTVAELTGHRRRWAAWKPWAVAGAGALVLAAGGALHAQSKSGFESYDAAFDQACTPGCEESERLGDMRRSAELQQKIAVTSYIVGGTAAAAGLVLVFVNRAQPFRRDIEAGAEGQLTVIPVLTPDSAGVSAAFRF